MSWPGKSTLLSVAAGLIEPDSGRVRVSGERGYAYFLYPKGATLTETSYDRLATIAQNNDLGAGQGSGFNEVVRVTSLPTTAESPLRFLIPTPRAVWCWQTPSLARLR